MDQTMYHFDTVSNNYCRNHLQGTRRAPITHTRANKKASYGNVEKLPAITTCKGGELGPRVWEQLSIPNNISVKASTNRWMTPGPVSLVAKGECTHGHIHVSSRFNLRTMSSSLINTDHTQLVFTTCSIYHHTCTCTYMCKQYTYSCTHEKRGHSQSSELRVFSVKKSQGTL